MKPKQRAFSLFVAVFALTHTARAQCNSWQNLGAIGYVADGSPLPSLAVDESTQTLYGASMCYCGGHGMIYPTIAQWTANGWLQLGPDFEVGNVGGLAICDLGSGPRLHVWSGDIPINFGARLLRWSGTQWEGVQPFLSEILFAVAAFDEGAGPVLFASTVSGVKRASGASWVLVGATTPAYSQPTQLLVHDDGSGPALFAAGAFTSIGGVNANGIARWNGSTWTALGNGLTSNGSSLVAVGSLRAIHDGAATARLYVAGQFDLADGAAANGLARWDGTNWTGLGTSLPGQSTFVKAVELFDRGTGAGPRIVVAGTTGTGTSALPFCVEQSGAGWAAFPSLAGGAIPTAPFVAFDLPGIAGRNLVATKHIGAGFSGYDEQVAFSACGLTGELSCFGDGSAAPCPCANESAPSEMAGCQHSFGYGGALRASGQASLSNDTLVLEGSAMTNSSALYFQGASIHAPTPFGDGLKCTGGPFIRFATKGNTAGASHYPEPADARVSVRGLITSPATRHYQVRYRNAAAFCAIETFNYTNAVSILWAP
jgi:hypothetical protein